MKVSSSSLLDFWLNPQKPQAFFIMVLIGLLLTGSSLAVYLSGGTSFTLVHLFYIPILIAGFAFSWPGGLIIGLVAGFIAGPLMPLNVALGLSQPAYAWLFRASFFCLTGVFAGLSSAIVRRYLINLKERVTVNPVTRLPNLYGLEVSFTLFVEKYPQAAVIIIKLGNLKEIELAIGGRESRGLVRYVARQLSLGITPSSLLGHISTSELLVVIANHNNLSTIVRQCQNSLDSSYRVHDIPLFFETYYGATRYPKDGASLVELVRKARVAIDRAQKKSVPMAIYRSHYDKYLALNVQLLHDLRQAIENDQLDLLYQAQVELASAKVVSVEALARWQHPQHGEISPGRFVALIENTLLITPFTHWMVKRALKDLSHWHQENIYISTALNFSVKNFHEQALENFLLTTLQDYRLEPQYVEIEITETAITTNIEALAETLRSLQDRGLKIAIDDFGTGQASQQYLLQLPVDHLKLDQLFIHAIGENAAAEAIISSVVLLAHQLNLKVTAEGIETPEKYRLLRSLGCDLGQGHLIAKPMTAEAISEWLTQSKGIVAKLAAISTTDKV
jgi:EAL domain-containing protein (putative c-di-GMP-specific phosphodiesterase class I)/GGDEF domain-containing protein